MGICFIGNEPIVDTTTIDNQNEPTVAALPDGRFGMGAVLAKFPCWRETRCTQRATLCRSICSARAI